MSDRKSELERKKQKLAMIREEKERRHREKMQEIIPDKSLQEPDLRTQAYELLESLGIPAESKGSTYGNDALDNDGHKTVFGHNDIQDNHTPTRRQVLSIVNVHQMNIPPKENVSYNKQTQTASLGSEREARPLDYYEPFTGKWIIESSPNRSDPLAFLLLNPVLRVTLMHGHVPSFYIMHRTTIDVSQSRQCYSLGCSSKFFMLLESIKRIPDRSTITNHF